jgi:hypothetical protein
MNATRLKLDHFQIYRIADQDARCTVKLQSQFDAEPEACELAARDWFALPVSKGGMAIVDRNAHLTRYRTKVPLPQDRRRIEIDNQFGKQTIFIGAVIGMLAPARKLERGSVFPGNLDHYKLYRVLDGKLVGKEFKLEDQFGKSEALVLHPYGFAAPAKKQHGESAFPIRNAKLHLTLYHLQPMREVLKLVKFKDQFAIGYAQSLWSALLAVPTVKLKWEEAA